MPIHQTKLRMSMPHATGTLTPHKPMPTNTRFVIVSSINWNSANESAKPKNQPSDVLRFRTIELILSVTDAKVSPGSMTGAVECIGPSVYGLFASSCIQFQRKSFLCVSVPLWLTKFAAKLTTETQRHREIGQKYFPIKLVEL